MTAAEQLIFTSCRYAIGGGSGFQVKSQSPGLDPADVNTIIQRSDYQRPLPSPGATEEGPSDCPVAVRWYALPSGGRALTRIVYVGVDYTGRPGNFLAHTLAFPPAIAGRVDPIAWLGWEGWLDALPAGADDDADVAALAPAHWAPATASEPAPRPPHGLDAPTLAHALAALFEAASRAQALVLHSSAADNVDGFRLLARCLPHAHIASIEFSTYEHSLRRLPALAMTVDGTAIDPRAGPQNGFVGAPFTNVPRPAPETAPGSAAGQTYGRIVSRIVFEQRELLPRFSRLLADVDFPPGPDLVAMAQVFLLVETGQEPDASPLELLRFALGHRENPAHAALIPALLTRLPPLVPDSFADRLLLARAWAHAMGLARAPGQGPAAARAFLHVLMAALPGWPSEERVVDELHDGLAADWGGDFDELVLQSARGETTALRAAFIAASPEGACALLQFMSAWQGGAATSPEMEDLVHELVATHNAAERLEALVRHMPGALHRAGLLEMANRARGLAPAALSTLLGQTLTRVAARLNVAEAAALRGQVPVPVLMMEWQTALARAEPIAASDALGKAYDAPGLLGRLTEAQRIVLRVAAARAYARVNAEDRLFEVLRDLDERDVLANLPARDRIGWITLVNDRLRLDTPATDASKARLALVGREKERLIAVPRPDRAALIALLEAINGGHKPDETDLTLLSDLDAVNEAERRHARTALLACAFQGLSSKRDGGLHDALMAGPLRAIGHDPASYREALAQLVPRSNASALVALLTWWFFDPNAAGCERLWSAVVRDLALTACRIDEASNVPPVGTKLASAASRPHANLARVEQWRRAYEAGPDGGLLRAAGRRVSGLLAHLGRRKP